MAKIQRKRKAGGVVVALTLAVVAIVMYKRREPVRLHEGDENAGEPGITDAQLP